MKFQKFFSFIIICIMPHTFLYGQAKERHFGEIAGIALPSAMITYGLISLGDNGIREIDYRTRHSLEINNRFWHTHVDDYMQFTPALAAYTLKLCNVESAHNLLDMTILYGFSSILAGSIISQTKTMTARERPDHSNNLSFPSGHTQTAFVAAEFLHQEYKNQSVWISIGGYSAATFVGIARVHNNKHWVSDVVAGAGIGILSTKFVYWIYPYFRKKSEKNEKNDQALQTFVFPGYSNGNISLNLKILWF